MEINLVFAFLMIGHILGDFYFQSNNIIKQKDEKISILFIHIVTYTLSFLSVVFAGIVFSRNLIYLGLFIVCSHLIIDFANKCYKKHIYKNSFLESIKKHSFIINQMLHIVSVFTAWLIWGKSLSLYPYLMEEYDNIPVNIILLALAILILLRPVGIIIENGSIWDFTKKDINTIEQNATDISNAELQRVKKNAGIMVGYLERFIILLLLIYHQYSAIAFVLTAKSIARYENIVKDKISADYYLIGTLLSVAFVIGIAFFLGLMIS